MPGKVRIKGGGRIHTYVFAVVFAGILFTLALSRMARTIGLRPREVIIAGLFVVIISIIFPFMLQRDLLWEWILLASFVLILCGLNFKQQEREEQSFSPQLLTVPQSLNELGSPETSAGLEDQRVTFALEDREVTTELKDHEATPELNQEDNGCVIDGLLWDDGETCLDAQSNDLSLEEMLERGFAAKEQLNFAEAAKWFLKIWASNPAPDIQVYVVMDLYEFAKVLNREKEAKTLVLDFQRRSLAALPVELQKEFNHWLTLNNLSPIDVTNN